jgi:CubicO group peptidase (beta-lactamase class C family)
MLCIRKHLFIFVVALLPFYNFSWAEQALKNTNKIDEFPLLEESIKAVLTKHEIVGFQLSLNGSQEIIGKMNYGFSAVLSKTAVNNDTLFRIASISKTVAAVAVMQLVDKGLLSLDDPIHMLIPEIIVNNPWRNEAPITILHLLEHTAGFDDNHFKEYVVDGATMSTKDALDYHPHTRMARYKPGQFMSYANVDPTLLAYIVEKLTGLTFEEYVKQYVFTPLMMEHSAYFLGKYVKDTLAQGYINANNTLTEAEYEHIKDRASGAINSNVSEMSAFQQMLINEGDYQGKSILAANTVKRMAITESTLAAKAGLKEGYGKFLVTQRSLDARWLGHNGAMNGFLSAMWHTPSRKIGYTFVMNTSGEKAYRADREINNLIREFIIKNYPKVERDIKPSKAPIKHSLSSKLYSAEIMGDYRQNTSRLSLIGFLEGLESFSTVFVEDDVVKMETSHSTYTLLPVEQNIFTTKTTSGDSVSAVFIEHNGQWHYQIPSVYINAQKTYAFTRIATYSLLVGFAVMALLVFTVWLIRLVLNLFRRKSDGNNVLGWISFANIGLISCLLFLGSAGNTGMPQTVLGQLSIQSVGITISLLMFCVFTLLSLIKFFKFNEQNVATKSEKALTFLKVGAISSNVLMLITLYYFDFLFVMLWQY